MAKMKHNFLVVSALLVLSTCVPFSRGARKEDVPYIKCQVCEKLASQLYQQVKKKQEQMSSRKISEYQIIQIVENVCNLKKDEADWILKIDIVEKGDKLELVEQDVEGHCNSECKTIEKACHEVIGYSDTDVAEFIYKSKPDIDSLINYLCKDLTDSCRSKPPPVPKDRAKGEPFVPKPSKDSKMDKLFRSMEGMQGIPPGMKVFSEEDLANYKKNMKKSSNKNDEAKETKTSKAEL